MPRSVKPQRLDTHHARLEATFQLVTSVTEWAVLHCAAQVVTGLTLLLICVLAFSVRLFSVIKYESVIHEFDPYFNYRVTRYLTEARRTPLDPGCDLVNEVDARLTTLSRSCAAV